MNTCALLTDVIEIVLEEQLLSLADEGELLWLLQQIVAIMCFYH